jgi:hypothetical protein
VLPIRKWKKTAYVFLVNDKYCQHPLKLSEKWLHQAQRTMTSHKIYVKYNVSVICVNWSFSRRSRYMRRPKRTKEGVTDSNDLSNSTLSWTPAIFSDPTRPAGEDGNFYLTQPEPTNFNGIIKLIAEFTCAAIPADGHLCHNCTIFQKISPVLNQQHKAFESSCNTFKWQNFLKPDLLVYIYS